MKRETGKAILYILLVILLIAVAGLTVFYVLEEDSIKSQVITAENMDKVIEKMEQKAKKDEELYYASYAMMYHIMQNGITNQGETVKDKNIIYKNVYGKTVKVLIEEGKQIMQDNDITLEAFKSSMQNGES